jgi:transposase-like protein
MNGNASSMRLSGLRCPICRAMHARKTGIAHNGSFACWQCHTVLEVTTSRSSQSFTLLATTIGIALSLSIAIGLQAPRFAMVVGAAAVLNWLGQTMRNLAALPELRVRPNAYDKGLPKNILSAHRADPHPKAARRRESLQCPLVVARD